MISHQFQRLFIFALLVALTACATTPTTHSESITFIVMRHAEKGTDDPRDPSLSAAGHARASKLASALTGESVVAVYATEYKRTQQTAQPIAQAHAISVSTYDANLPATELIAGLKQKHRDGTVVIVGHSNTVPDIVSALCACAVNPLDDDDYGTVFTITFSRGEPPVVRELHDP